VSKPNGAPGDAGRVLICVLCERRIDPKREGAPANADVKAHKRCAVLA
jgi:hypothetical protein